MEKSKKIKVLFRLRSLEMGGVPRVVLDLLRNLPKDFSIEYFENFLDYKINKIAYRNWVEKFKTQYKNLGREVN